MTLFAVKTCLWLREGFFLPIEFLNRCPAFPIFYATPLPYAIGTCSEDIRHIFEVSTALKKNPNLIYLPSFRGLLQFNVAAKALFTLRINTTPRATTSQILVGGISRVVHIYVILIFVLSRLSYIFLHSFYIRSKKIDHSKSQRLNEIFDRLSFPRLGLNSAYSILHNLLLINKSFHEEVLKAARMRNLRFSNHYYLEWNKYLDINNIDLRHEYIVIHTRSAHYHSDIGRRPFRNVTLKSYGLLIERLLHCGYKVVLIGGTIEEPLGVEPNNNLYDLRYGTRAKPCSLDVFLVANCYKYIGMMSGPLDVAVLFGRKMYILNAYTPYYCVGYPAEAFYLLQRHESSIGNRISGISNLLKAGVSIVGLQELNLQGYELSQLSADDLLKFCNDIILDSPPFSFSKDSCWSDVTYLSRRPEPIALSNNDGCNESMSLTDSQRRWVINRLLSGGCVMIYESN